MMLQININDNRDLYEDYRKCLVFLENLNFEEYEYPNEVTNFHVYSDVKTEKELLCIQSFLATQNLNKTRLVLWSDKPLSKNKFLDPYRPYITERLYGDQEATGTVLEGTPILKAHDSKFYMRSGVLRFLVTHNYGGIWADMDMVFLRDFKPLLNQEWAYMWGAELDFSNFGPCAAMMHFKEKSILSQMCLQEVANTEPVENSTVLDHILLAKVYKKTPFTVFPSVFFNTEWQMNTKYVDGHKIYDPDGPGTKVETGWFNNNIYSQFLFREAFAWHWHNSSHKNDRIEKGSKFQRLQSETISKLKTIGIL